MKSNTTTRSKRFDWWERTSKLARAACQLLPPHLPTLAPGQLSNSLQVRRARAYFASKRGIKCSTRLLDAVLPYTAG
jgi:hypothetical protein